MTTTHYYSNSNLLLRFKLTTPPRNVKPPHCRPQTLLLNTSFPAERNHHTTTPLNPLIKNAQLNQHSFLTTSSLQASHNDRINETQQTPLKQELNIVANHEKANQENKNKKSFWGAVSLIIGTAVGPGMLGLPSLTIKSGPIPSTISIILSWIYVISSIILIAELTFISMKEQNLTEITFTTLATNTFGPKIGVFISLIYATLSFSLLIACVSGIGSIISQFLPSLHILISHSLFPSFIGTLILFFPYHVIDSTNRVLCFLMLVFITSLIAIGSLSMLNNPASSIFVSSWKLSSMLASVPVTVLTLGFHVITPYICKIAGDTVEEARKAVLIGGMVPLVMVLSWNFIVLGLAAGGKMSDDPIMLLLSVKSEALFVVRGFAFSALATSLIGYAISFPKQISDTLELVMLTTGGWGEGDDEKRCNGVGRVGYNDGKVGKVVFYGSSAAGLFSSSVVVKPTTGGAKSRKVVTSSNSKVVVLVVLVFPVIVASFYQSTFAKALDFAGVYANCFLFGILPPLMAYVYKHKKNKLRSSALPGGDVALFLLFGIAVVLGIWH